MTRPSCSYCGSASRDTLTVYGVRTCIDCTDALVGAYEHDQRDLDTLKSRSVSATSADQLIASLGWRVQEGAEST